MFSLRLNFLGDIYLCSPGGDSSMAVGVWLTVKALVYRREAEIILDGAQRARCRERESSTAMKVQPVDG